MPKPFTAALPLRVRVESQWVQSILSAETDQIGGHSAMLSTSRRIWRGERFVSIN